jgi:hypothetical protein
VARAAALHTGRPSCSGWGKFIAFCIAASFLAVQPYGPNYGRVVKQFALRFAARIKGWNKGLRKVFSFGLRRREESVGHTAPCKFSKWHLRITLVCRTNPTQLVEGFSEQLE